MVTSRDKKVKRTCNACRLRKVRCDGQLTGCAACQRLGFDCLFGEANGQGDHVVPLRPPRRCRVRQACTACHELKIRCTGTMPKCHRCDEKGIVCRYSNSRSQRQAPSVAAMEVGTQHHSTPTTRLGGAPSQLPSPAGGNSSPLDFTPDIGQGEETHSVHPSDIQPLDLLTPTRVKNALQSYFDHIYPLPTFSFLHKASLLRWNQAGHVDHCLLLSIIAITSRLSGTSSTEVRLGARCSTLAQNALLRDQGRPNIIKTQSLLLTIRYHMWSGNTTEALMLMATLTRFAFTLRLNYGNRTLCSLAQESRRRLMWSIYVLDTFLAGGLPEFTLCPSDVLHISLPNQETAFELDTSYANVPLYRSNDESEMADIGLLGYYIRVIYLRDAVLRRTKEVVSTPQQLGAILAVKNNLESQIDRFALNLPLSVTFSEKNLHLRAYSKWLSRYIIMHLWLQQCYCDLYRCFFANLRESFPDDVLFQLDPEFVLDCQLKCVRHARQITSICSLVRELGSHNLILDMETAECVYQAGRIILHATQSAFGTDQLEDSPEGPVNDCIHFIEQLALMFPTAGPIAKDLSTVLRNSRSGSISSNNVSMMPTSETAQDCRILPRNGKQIISKHSSLNRSQLDDEAMSADMPFVEGRRRGSCTPIPVPESGAITSIETPPGGVGLNHRHGPNTYISSHDPGTFHSPVMSRGFSGFEGQDMWSQTSAFEGASDVAIFHPMYDQQDFWHALNFFPSHIDMDINGE